MGRGVPIVRLPLACASFDDDDDAMSVLVAAAIGSSLSLPLANAVVRRKS